MKFYHGTTVDNWILIQQEGVLWGRPNTKWEGNLMDRATWLAIKKENAGIYDSKGITNQRCIILEVDMPEYDGYEHLFSSEVWQIVVYHPILLSHIRCIEDPFEEDRYENKV